jgi:transcriptional regulator with XRE-family HTH domain
MPSFKEKLIRAVIMKRKAEGLSIRALSAEIGVSFSTLARIERGDGQPDNNSKIRLLQWLGPDAEDAGLSFDNVAFVHFRAGKNIRSSTVHTLLRAADCLRQSMGGQSSWKSHDDTDDNVSADGVSLSKEELEQAAEKFRTDLGLAHDEPLDSLRIEVDGVWVIPAGETNFEEAPAANGLR